MNIIDYNKTPNILLNIGLDSYELLNNQELIWLLKSNVKEERGIAAKFLSEREVKQSLPYIAQALEVEKDEYIAMIMLEAQLNLLSASEWTTV
jgi:hypothetical protein